MFKVIDFDAFRGDQQVVFPLDLTKPLLKQASWQIKLADEVAGFCRSIEAHPERSYFVNVALGAGETWGCFPPGSLVTMADWSEKAIDDIQAGEIVRTRDGSSQKVLSKFRKLFDDYLVKLHVRGVPDPIRLTPNHKVLCIPKEQVQCVRAPWSRCTPDSAGTRSVCRGDFPSWAGKNCSPCAHRPDLAPTWIPAGDLREGDLLLEPRVEFGDAECSQSDRDLGRILGLFFAEGNKIKHIDGDRNYSHYRLAFGFHENEVDTLVADLSERVDRSFGRKTRTRQVGQSRGVLSVFNSKFLYRAVETFCAGDYSHTKHFTEHVWRQPREFVSHLVGGYVDGDGSVALATRRKTKRTGHGARVTVRSTSRQLLKDIRRALLSLGLSSSWFWTDDPEKYRKENSGFPNPKPWGNLEFNGESAQKALAGCFKTEKVGKPKHQKRYSFFWDRYHVSPIKKIERYRYCGPVHNLEVDGSHTYLVSGQIVSNSNKNGDWFPRAALSHEGDDYGYQTFLKAGRFRSHRNKDPKASLGKIVYAHWNPRMDRVELVSWLDRTKAPDIAERLDDFENTGEKIATSMGCKVPHDTCVICFNKAASVSAYCNHLKTAMGRILPGGRAIYAINDKPFFFDDSFVVAPAAKEAGVTLKVASVQPIVLSAERGLEVYGEDKGADEKASAITKKLPAEVEIEPEDKKRIEEGRQLMADLRPVLDATETKIATGDLDKLAALPLEGVLATSAAMGIVLRPEEFQKLALCSRGAVLTAAMLEADGLVFDPDDQRAVEESDGIKVARMDLDAFDPRVEAVLRPYQAGRSYWEPFFSRRLDKLAARDMQPVLTRASVQRENQMMKSAIAPLDIMLPLALGYVLYRMQLGGQNLSKLDELISRRPGLGLPILGIGAGALSLATMEPPGRRVSEKTAGILGRFVVPGTAPYLYSAEVTRKEREGYPLTGFERLVKEHPGTLALLSIGTAGMLARKSKAISEAVKKLFKEGAANRPTDEQIVAQMIQETQAEPASGSALSDAAKLVAAGVYKARHFPGALVDELVLRQLIG